MADGTGPGEFRIGISSFDAVFEEQRRAGLALRTGFVSRFRQQDPVF